MMNHATAESNARLARALDHPIRERILTYLRDHDDVSAIQLSKMWELDVSVISYHVKRLAALRFLHLVKRVPRRGAIEHRYALRADVRAEVPGLGLILDDSDPRRITAADVGASVRRRRHNRGMTPGRLAYYVGVPVEAVVAIEKGDDTAQLGTLLALASCLDTSLRELVS